MVGPLSLSQRRGQGHKGWASVEGADGKDGIEARPWTEVMFVYSRTVIFNWGQFFSQGDILQCMETYLIVTSVEVGGGATGI